MFVGSPVDELHRVAGALGQRRLVGRLDAGLRRAPARRASTSRRNACGVCARKIDSRGSVSATNERRAAGRASPDRVALHGVARRQRRERRARFRRRGNRPRDEVGARKRPRGVVDDDHVARRARRPETRSSTESCRRAPPATTRSGFGVPRRYGGRIGRRAPAGSATTTSSIVGMREERASRCARGSDARRPPAAAWARAPPNRWPRPPAAMMAVTNMGEADDYIGACAVCTSQVRADTALLDRRRRRWRGRDRRAPWRRARVGASMRRRLNRIVDDERHVGRLGPQPALRHHRARADDRERHDRQPRLDRQQEAAGLEPRRRGRPRLRVPSAKMMSDSPSDTSARQRCRMPARSGCRRSTNRWPPRFRCQPSTGNRASDSFAMMRS